MERYGITEGECREAVARVLTGDLREREDIEELKPYSVLQRMPQDGLQDAETSSGRDGKQDREDEPQDEPDSPGREAGYFLRTGRGLGA